MNDNELLLAAEAAAPGALTSGLSDMLQTGGPVVGLLIVMSVVALAIVLAKLWQFQQIRLSDNPATLEAIRLWQGGHPGQANAMLGTQHGPLASAVRSAIGGLQQGMPASVVREEATRQCSDVLDDLKGWMRPLEVIATLAPLLGLFGTVLGMIEAFRQLEEAGNQVNPAILSGGIWEALLTTAVGLAVAIPTVALLNFLERRIERLAHQMDSSITRLFTRNLPVFRTGEGRNVGTDAAGHAIAVGSA